MFKQLATYWVGQGVRLSENSALVATLGIGRPLATFIVNDHMIGGVSRWLLYQSPSVLAKSIRAKLRIGRGNVQDILRLLVKKHENHSVTWNRSCESSCTVRDERIKAALSKLAIKHNSFNGSVFWELWQVRKKEDTPCKMDPFFHRSYFLNTAPLSKPRLIFTQAGFCTLSVDEHNLLSQSHWDQKPNVHWPIGETVVQFRLKKYISKGLGDDEQRSNSSVKTDALQLVPNQTCHDFQRLVSGINEDCLRLVLND